jgi:signal peptide peptidase SppA
MLLRVRKCPQICGHSKTSQLSAIDLSCPRANARCLLSYALNYLMKTNWAMTDEALLNLISVVRTHKRERALERFPGESVKNAHRAYNRGGVGIIPVRDSLFMRANLMTRHCGATAYETLMHDFHRLIEDTSIQSILFEIDSPGGEAGGCSELSDAIFEARGRKPIFAYISDYGASAAYWIASACDRIYASDSAIVGSIGVQIVAHSETSDNEIRIVASQSPNKNIDPGTEAGEKALQERADALAEIFIQKVARNRGISRETVLEKYGQGGVLVGENARKEGLVDEISTFEKIISFLGEKTLKPEEITTAYIAEERPDIARYFLAEGEKATLARIAAEDERKSRIRALGKGQVSDGFLSVLIDRGVSVQDAAMQILEEAQKNPLRTISNAAQKEHDAQLAELNTPPVSEAARTGDEKAILDRQLEAALHLSQKIDEFKIRGVK